MGKLNPFKVQFNPNKLFLSTYKINHFTSQYFSKNKKLRKKMCLISKHKQCYSCNSSGHASISRAITHGLKHFRGHCCAIAYCGTEKVKLNKVYQTSGQKYVAVSFIDKNLLI